MTGDYWDRVRPLGPLRCRLLDCLGANDPRRPCHFDPPADAPLLPALAARLDELTARFGGEPGAAPLLAAGRLSCGRLDALSDLLAVLPTEPVHTDHGAGKCLRLPAALACSVLPLPYDLTDPAGWVAGTPTAERLKVWATATPLVWDEAAARFLIGG